MTIMSRLKAKLKKSPAAKPAPTPAPKVILVPDKSLSPATPQKRLITVEQLRRGLGITLERADYWDDWLNEAMLLYGINNRNRIGIFLAQVGHESGRLKYTSEIWGPTPTQRRYEGRKDLGNIYPGDGSRFRGHGLIQTTGRHNHRRVTQRLRARFPNMGVPDFEAEPTKLTLPRWASLSAADYWDMINANPLADRQEFTRITKLINGGTNGLADRKSLWAQLLKVV